MFGRRKSQRKKVAQMLPFSPWMLVVLIAACALVVYFLIPTDKRMLAAHLSDQEWGKASQALAELTSEERAKRPEYYSATELKVNRMQLDPTDQGAWITQLGDALREAEAYNFPEQHLLEIELAAEKVPSGSTVYTIIEPYLNILPTEMGDKFQQDLTTKILAENKPVMAMEIYQKYWSPRAADPQITLNFIDLARGGGRPDLAIQAILKHEVTLDEPLFKASRQLAKLKIDLHRENGQPVEAFELMKVFYAAVDDETKKLLYPEYVQMGEQANQATSLLIEVQRIAEANPTDLPAWEKFQRFAEAAGRQDLAIRALEQITRLQSSDALLRMKLGQRYEWTGHPNEAFDQYAIALQLKHAPAAEELLRLNPGLYRDVELANLLSANRSLVDSRKHGRYLAGLFANVNEFDTAKGYYEEVLEQLGEDVEVLHEYGLLMLDLGRLDEAMVIYDRAAAAKPDDLKTLVATAEAQFRANRFDQSLKTYARVLQLDPTRAQLGNYLRLAESLGRLGEAGDTLSDFVKAFDKPTHEDFSKLLYFYSVAGETNKILTLLHEGVAKFPEDLELRKQLVYALSDRGQADEAARVISTMPNFEQDKGFAELYLSSLLRAKNWNAAEKFILHRLPKGRAEEWGLHSTLANIYYETGNREAAMGLYGKIYHQDPSNSTNALTYAQYLLEFKRNAEARNVLISIPDGAQPLAHKIAAQLYAEDKDYKRALFYQQKYLKTEPQDSGRDWGFLGDIHGERGHKAQAQGAYQRAIVEMLKTIEAMASK
jgi:tetratricopeptide (TPR) repeat protein